MNATKSHFSIYRKTSRSSYLVTSNWTLSGSHDIGSWANRKEKLKGPSINDVTVLGGRGFCDDKTTAFVMKYVTMGKGVGQQLFKIARRHLWTTPNLGAVEPSKWNAKRLLMIICSG